MKYKFPSIFMKLNINEFFNQNFKTENGDGKIRKAHERGGFI